MKRRVWILVAVLLAAVALFAVRPGQRLYIRMQRFLKAGAVIAALAVALMASSQTYAHSQAISLGSDPFDNANNAWTGAVLVDAALIDGGGTAYLREIDPSGIHVRVKLSSTSTGDADVAGPEFTTAFETYATAFTFSESGGSSIVLKGPHHPGNIFQDGSEVYYWTPDNSNAWSTWHTGLGSGVVTLTLDDGQTVTNTAPTASATGTPTTVDGGGEVTLDGTASDDDDDTLTYSWASSGGGTFGDDSALDTTWTAPAATDADQSITLTLTVNDGTTSTSAEVDVTVNASAGAVEVARMVITVGTDTAKWYSIFSGESIGSYTGDATLYDDTNDLVIDRVWWTDNTNQDFRLNRVPAAVARGDNSDISVYFGSGGPGENYFHLRADRKRRAGVVSGE